MQSLTRTELRHLLGLAPPRMPAWTEGTNSVEGDLRIRTYALGPAQIPAISIALLTAQPGDPALLYCHAHGNAYGIGKSEVLEGRPALLDPPLAKVIARAGWTVFCADMPGFGARQSDGIESALAKAALWRGRPLLGQMVDDQLMAIDALTEIARPSRLATLGISMGGTLAYLIAALRDEISLLAHLCVFADIAPLIETGAHDLHGPYMTIPGLLPTHDMGDIAALVAPRRHLVATGGADPLTPDSAYDPAVGRLIEAYKDHADRLTIVRDPNAGHQETLGMRKAVLSFLAAGHSSRKPAEDA
ncbi:MAG: hypothetical protein AAFU80_11200 [Pseudomonadota bacterium]